MVESPKTMHIILTTAFLQYSFQQITLPGELYELDLSVYSSQASTTGTRRVSFPLSGLNFIPAHPTGKNDYWSFPMQR